MILLLLSLLLLAVLNLPEISYILGYIYGEKEGIIWYLTSNAPVYKDGNLLHKLRSG
jgi:hypothetical protein